MPPKLRLGLLLRGLAKLIAVIVVAGAAGTGLGFGLAALTGDDSTSGSPDTTTTDTLQHAETAATHTMTTTRQAGTSTGGVQVVSAVLHQELAPAGGRGNRARLAVHVRVANEGERTIERTEPFLVAGPRGRVDPSAAATTGSLLRPVPPGSTADGILRFETAGALTARSPAPTAPSFASRGRPSR